MTKPDRRQALIDLVALPNPPGTYGTRPKLEGKADRFQDVPKYAAVWIQQHQVDVLERGA